MTLDSLKKAKELELAILKRNNLLKATKEQNAEWIDFTFGNGSNKSCVCDDLGLIGRIREMIIADHESAIEQLHKELGRL